MIIQELHARIALLEASREELAELLKRTVEDLAALRAQLGVESLPRESVAAESRR